MVNAGPGSTATKSKSSKKPGSKGLGRFNWKIVGGVVLLTLLVVGAAAGFYLSQQGQDIRQQAAVEGPGDDCDPNAWTLYGSCQNWRGDACEKRRVNNCGQFEYQGCAPSECGYQPDPSPPQTAWCYDQNQNCNYVNIPANECASKFGDKQACLNSLSKPALSYGQLCSAVQGCTCPSDAEGTGAGPIQSAQRCGAAPNLITCCINPGTQTQSEVQIESSLCVSPAVGRQCYRTNCYDSNQGCSLTTIYDSNTCSAGNLYQTQSECEAALPEEDIICWTYPEDENGPCIQKTYTTNQEDSTCDELREAGIDLGRVYESAGVCAEANPFGQTSGKSCYVYSQSRGCELSSSLTATDDGNTNTDDCKTEHGSTYYDTITECQNNQVDLPIGPGQTCPSSRGCICSTGPEQGEQKEQDESCAEFKDDSSRCTESSECRSGFCVPVSDGGPEKVCGKPSVTKCPAGQVKIDDDLSTRNGWEEANCGDGNATFTPLPGETDFDAVCASCNTEVCPVFYDEIGPGSTPEDYARRECIDLPNYDVIHLQTKTCVQCTDGLPTECPALFYETSSPSSYNSRECNDQGVNVSPVVLDNGSQCVQCDVLDECPAGYTKIDDDLSTRNGYERANCSATQSIDLVQIFDPGFICAACKSNELLCSQQFPDFDKYAEAAAQCNLDNGGDPGFEDDNPNTRGQYWDNVSCSCLAGLECPAFYDKTGDPEAYAERECIDITGYDVQTLADGTQCVQCTDGGDGIDDEPPDYGDPDAICPSGNWNVYACPNVAGAPQGCPSDTTPGSRVDQVSGQDTLNSGTLGSYVNGCGVVQVDCVGTSGSNLVFNSTIFDQNCGPKKYLCIEGENRCVIASYDENQQSYGDYDSLAECDTNCSPVDLPSPPPSVPPGETPPPPSGPQCRRIEMQDATSSQPVSQPEVGQSIRFLCGVPQDAEDSRITRFDFRVVEPDGNVVNIDAISSGARQSQNYIVRNEAGTFYGQCRICTAEGCQPFEPTN